MLERDQVAKGSILLVSDLETAPDDVPALAQTIAALKQADIRLRVVPLAPSSDAVSLFSGLLEKDAVATFAQTPAQAEPDAGIGGVSTPLLLLLLGALVVRAARRARAIRRPPRAAAPARSRRRAA